MTAGPPAASGAFEPYGGARRASVADGTELFRFDVAERALAERLSELGRSGLLGFTRDGADDEGPWLVRARLTPTLSALLRERDLPPIEALVLVRRVARLLAETEAFGLFPGPLSPRAIVVPETGEAFLPAEPLLARLLGAPAVPEPERATRWIPPEQADGLVWDHAANRYVLGLIVYRMLAGEHPFSGKGVRLAFEDQRTRGPSPFPEERAARLPAGLQSYCLKWLSPHRPDRPGSAETIVAELSGFLTAMTAPVSRALDHQRDEVERTELSVARATPASQQVETRPLRSPDREPPHPVRVSSRAAKTSDASLLRRRNSSILSQVCQSGRQVGLGPHAQRARNGGAEVGKGTRASSARSGEGSASDPSQETSGQLRPQGRLQALHARVGLGQSPVSSTLGAAAPEPHQWLASPRDGAPHGRPSNTGSESAERAPLRSRGRASWTWWTAALAVLLVPGVLWALRPQEAPAPATRRPLSRPDLSLDDCASCHPRQTAEWKRSVMAHAATSPLFQALEMLIESEIGRSDVCPEGAGVLRRADLRTACRDANSGIAVTGSGGEHWCVNCHAASENLGHEVPAWDAVSRASRSRRPLADLLSRRSLEGISCAFCHQVEGPVEVGAADRGGYEGNAFWTSTRSGERFRFRPEERRGVRGIANSGYLLDPSVFLLGGKAAPGAAHRRLAPATRNYLRSSEFCGACHDVRLAGSDVIGARRGEHFKRLRNAYSEWAEFAAAERRAGRVAPSCQDCHMSLYPGVCRPGAARAEDSTARACPPGMHVEPTEPGTYASGISSTAPLSPSQVRSHYFSGVDVPLSEEFPSALIDDPSTDEFGVPLGAEQRRLLLLSRSVEMKLGVPVLAGALLEIPIEFVNTTGHRVPAGFSQERELWVHLEVRDARGRTIYEVGRVDEPTQDLRDKRFLSVNTDDALLDEHGRPLGLFGADVADGRDVGQWTPPPDHGGRSFVGRGLINFQNGFLRCVVCIGRIDARGRCQPLPGQEGARADRYADGEYDPDTGECASNLSGNNALFETYFPVGALDATRGVLKGPDAIIDTRSLPPGEVVRYRYALPAAGAAPYRVTARLLFRAFPPFLLRAFIDYEERQSARGKRPSGPLLTERALERLGVVELEREVQSSAS